MSDISAKQVKELRELTGAGLMECKRSLVETDGDQEKAVELLRKRNAEMAGKKAGRATRNAAASRTATSARSAFSETLPPLASAARAPR